MKKVHIKVIQKDARNLGTHVSVCVVNGEVKNTDAAERNRDPQDAKPFDHVVLRCANFLKLCQIEKAAF